MNDNSFGWVNSEGKQRVTIQLSSRFKKKGRGREGVAILVLFGGAQMEQRLEEELSSDVFAEEDNRIVQISGAKRSSSNSGQRIQKDVLKNIG